MGRLVAGKGLEVAAVGAFGGRKLGAEGLLTGLELAKPRLNGLKVGVGRRFLGALRKGAKLAGKLLFPPQKEGKVFLKEPDALTEPSGLGGEGGA